MNIEDPKILDEKFLSKKCAWLYYVAKLNQNQIAAKELFIAKFYISTQKWVPAIQRLKLIVSDYDKTIYIEEALHRLVEIHYHIGLKQEAEKYAKILALMTLIKYIKYILLMMS